MQRILVGLLWVFCFCGLTAQPDTSRLFLEDVSYSDEFGNVIVTATKGRFLVPENRQNPDSDSIFIHFTRLNAPNAPQQPPLVYLSGGPGSSSSWMAENEGYRNDWLGYLAIGDVIFLDQRGTGAGGERVTYISTDPLPADVLTDSTIRQKYLEGLNTTALQSFQERGVDLAGYTTLENATDIDELRRALGYDQVNLYGFSYGTHLGQTYIKYFGAHVANAVLVGVEGLNHTFKLPLAMDLAFQKIALLVAADSTVNQLVPDFLALYERVVAKLDANPMTVQVRSPITNKKMTLKVGSWALNMILRYDIGDASDIPVFPRLLYSIDQGDDSVLRWFVQKRIGNLFGIQGMGATMDIASGGTESRQLRIERERNQSYFKDFFTAVGDLDWPQYDLGADFRAPFVSPVRTLFMSGTLDFNTPPYQAEEVRWGFSNSAHIIITNAGHEQIERHPQTQATVLAFLRGEKVDEIALAYPPLRFIPVTGEVDRSGPWHPAVEN